MSKMVNWGVCKTCKKEHFCKESMKLKENCPNCRKIIIQSRNKNAKNIRKKRSEGKCEICGWNEASLDVHHKLEISKGGTNEMDNLMTLCPNCHRVLHKFK